MYPNKKCIRPLISYFRLLTLLKEQATDPFATNAMALAHLGETDMAIDTLVDHINTGGYFNYLPGDPFWAPLAEDARFMSIVEDHHNKATQYRAQVQALIDSDKLVLPGQLEHPTLVQDKTGL